MNTRPLLRQDWSSHLILPQEEYPTKVRPCMAIEQEKIEFLRDHHLSWEKKSISVWYML